MGNYGHMEPARQSELFYEVFIARRDGRVSITALALASGFAESTIYEIVSDHRREKPVWLWRAAFETSGDHRFKMQMEPQGWILIPDPRFTRPATTSLTAELTDPILAASQALEALRQALRDGRIDPQENAEIRRHIDMVRHECAQAECLLDETEERGGMVPPEHR